MPLRPDRSARAPVQVTAVPPDGMSSILPAVRSLEAAARATDGHANLGAAVWRDLDDPGLDSAGFLAPRRAYAHVARSDSFEAPHWVLGIVVHPDARDGATVDELLEAATAHVAEHGGGQVVLWVAGAHPRDDDSLGRVGFDATREVYEMRVGLPLGEVPRWPPGTTVRPFEPGRDEAAWLAVNNRAFRNHPEQGGWIEATLARRMSEPWFDPALFLLAFDESGLAGFDWLKVHDAYGDDPALGEIFVIGVDPRVHGTGLGRALAVAGLGAVAARGITTGMLYCAADNAPALRLYHRIGFAVHRVDRAYERLVGAS